MIDRNLISIVQAFVFSLISIFIVLKLTKRFGLYDTVDERKVHTGQIPRLGGVGIFLGFLIGVLSLAGVFGGENIVGYRVWNLLSACILIFIMGVWDDLSPWRARVKLLVQIIAAVIVIVGGLSFTRFSESTFGLELNLGWLGPVITFFWIIGVTNALNLIDGIDGLAGTVTSLATVTFAFLFLQNGNISAFFVCIVLVASVAGFLVYNLPLPKAKIFMGDGGSQFLGFALAVLPLLPANDGSVYITLPLAAAVLMIPIFDTIAAMWRRTREGRSFLEPDKFHLHHKLMMMGFSAPQALVLLASFQLIISLLVIVAARAEGVTSLVSLVSLYFIGILFFTVVHVRKEEILEKSKLL